MINVEIKEQLGRSCLKPNAPPKPTGQLEIWVDGSLAGFLGTNAGEGVRLHQRFPPGELQQILDQVRELRPAQDVPTIHQAPESIAIKRGVNTTDMET